jgi:hypothetical protein
MDMNSFVLDRVSAYSVWPVMAPLGQNDQNNIQIYFDFYFSTLISIEHLEHTKTASKSINNIEIKHV